MNRKELVAEILTKVKQYDEAGLVDYYSLNNWIKNSLREFGGNIMYNTGEMLEVVNGTAKLPENFYSLVLALKCEPYQYYVEEKDRKYLQSSIFYTERLEKTMQWENNNSEPCKPGIDCKYVVENTYFIDSTGSKRDIRLYYGSPYILKLKKGHHTVKCERECLNLNTLNREYEITIQGGYVHTNFNEGSIYLYYRGLPVDEEGDLIIPEIQRNKLVEYIQYTCLRRIFEDLWINGDDPDVQNKWQAFLQMEKQAYIEAKNDTVNEGLSGWAKSMKEKNKLRSLKYEIMFNPR